MTNKTPDTIYLLQSQHSDSFGCMWCEDLDQAPDHYKSEAVEYRKFGAGDEQLLVKIAEQLERWANESRLGGWSTHQVEPQRDLARKIWAHIGRTRR